MPAQKQKPGPEPRSTPKAEETSQELRRDMELEVKYYDLESVQCAPFELQYSDGSTYKGTLDINGTATLKNVPLGPMIIKLGEDTREYTVKDTQPASTYKEQWTEADMQASLQAALANGDAPPQTDD